MIYPPSQKPPIWSIDPGVIAYNCQKAGMPHPVLAMPMWEGGGNLARDYSGHGNHGTINGADWVADGLDFIAANSDSVTVGDSDLLGIGSEITINARIYPKSLAGAAPAGNHIVGKKDEWMLLVENGEIFFRTFGGNSGGDGSSLSTNTWYDITAVWDVGTNVVIYINGAETQDVVITNPSVPTLNDLNICIDYVGARPFDGAIDGIQIINTALSAAQVKFLSDNPYFMYQIPEELYGYVAAAPPTGNPFWYYNMLRRRN